MAVSAVQIGGGLTAATRLQGLARGDQARVSRRRQGGGQVSRDLGEMRSGPGAGGGLLVVVDLLQRWSHTGAQVPLSVGSRPSRPGTCTGYGGKAKHDQPGPGFLSPHHGLNTDSRRSSLLLTALPRSA